MYRKYWIIGILFINLISIETQAQVIYPRPNPPTFNYLTIDLTTGYPTLYWTAPAYDPQYPDPTGYIIQKDMFVNGLWTPNEPFDYVASTVFSYTDSAADGNAGKVWYSIKSRGNIQHSPQTFPKHASIFITADYDSCNSKIDLTWNLYEGWANSTIYPYYYLYTGNTPDWHSFTLKDSIYKFNNQYHFTNVSENQDYYFYLTAHRIDKPFTTYSNLCHKFTYMPAHPANMSVDSIIAEDQRVNIYYKIDPSTELTDFQIVRWENADYISSIFSRKFSDPATTYYADTIDSWAARTRPFYYKIYALNSCPAIVEKTNLANTIIPVVQNNGMINTIQWNKLFIDTAIPGHEQNYAYYRVIRYAYTTVAQPPVYLYPTMPQVDDDVHEFEGKGYSVKFCYQVEAYERNPLGANVMLSRSRILCAEVVPGVTMPDAIAPTDKSFYSGNNARNILVPIITFEANYTLSVYNRWGDLVFNGDNKGWDGRISGGKLANEGTYVYRLVVHTSGNRDVIKTGNVSVVYP